jgi:hypothetical protein
MLVSCLAYYSTVKMEAICSSDTSVDVNQTIRCYVPKDRTLHSVGFVGHRGKACYKVCLQRATQTEENARIHPPPQPPGGDSLQWSRCLRNASYCVTPFSFDNRVLNYSELNVFEKCANFCLSRVMSVEIFDFLRCDTVQFYMYFSWRWKQQIPPKLCYFISQTTSRNPELLLTSCFQNVN